MKRKGCISDYIEARNADIMRAFHEQIDAVSFINLPDIFAAVSESPSVRFWVSEERAAVVISLLFAGRKLPPMRPCKREMFMEIFRRAKILRGQDPTLTAVQMAITIVHQPAPCFYLTPRSVQEIYYKIKRGFYDEFRDRCNLKRKSQKD